MLNDVGPNRQVKHSSLVKIHNSCWSHGSNLATPIVTWLIPGTSDPALLSNRCLSPCSGVICEAPAFWIFSNGNFLIQLGTGMNRLWPKILVQFSQSILVTGCLSFPEVPPLSALHFFAPACLADACFPAVPPKHLLALVVIHI